MITPKSAELVTLSEPGHVYTVGEGLTEREPPSLSRLIEGAGLATDYSQIDPTVLAFAAARGTLVHKLIEGYWNQQEDLDPYSIDPLLWESSLPYYQCFLDWVAKAKPECLITETPAYNPDLDYACTADFIGKTGGDPWVIDYKTTSRLSGAVAIQTMGQAECFLYDDAPRRGALWLKKRGRAELVEYTDHKEDFADLAAIARVWDAKKRRKP